MDGFNVREAVADDRDDVIGIRDVYGGSDYLPAYYQHFVTSVAITPFVLLYQDKIIGFCAAHILDEGETVIMRAVRLHRDFEGKGLYGFFDAQISKWAKSKGVTVKAFTTSDKNPNIKKDSFKSVNDLILSKKVWIFTFETDQILIDDTTANILPEVSDSLLTSYISTEDTKQYLFPANRVIIDYLPCKLLKSNVRFMRGPEDFTTIYTDVKVENDVISGLLSCGTLYTCKEIDFHCTIEIFGTDKWSLKTHILNHLKIIKKNTSGILKIGLYIDESFPLEFIEDMFSSFGIKRTEADIAFTNSQIAEIVLYEKKL